MHRSLSGRGPLPVPTTFPAVTLEQDSTGPGFINPTNPSQISLHPHKTPLDPFLNTPKGLPHACCLIVDQCFHRAETKDGENAQRSVITARPRPAALSWVTAGRSATASFFFFYIVLINTWTSMIDTVGVAAQRMELPVQSNCCHFICSREFQQSVAASLNFPNLELPNIINGTYLNATLQLTF